MSDEIERLAAIVGVPEEPVIDDAPFATDEVEAPEPPEPVAGDGIDWELVRRCAEEALNDIGNSRRFSHRYGRQVLHVQRLGWHAYDGRRWADDIDLRILRPMAHRVVDAIALEARVIEPTAREQEAIDSGGAGADAARKAVAARSSQRRRFATASGNKGKIDGMLAELVSRVSRPIGDLDADPYALNVQNGTLRFREVEEEDLECPDPEARRFRKVWGVRLDPHRREDLISKIADVAYDPAAEAPLFMAFLARVQPDPATRLYLARYFGYGLIGTAREQVFALLYGEGANGKSTLVDLCCRIMGDYATSLPIATLIGDTSKRGAEATPDLARLPGARFVRTAEPKEGLPLNEDVIKTLTSSEPVPIRRLHQEFIDVYPVFNLVISANRKPEIRGDNDGIWRRVHLVPFDVQIPPEERDKMLADKLWEERSGILNWLIGGALDYLACGGLDPPPTVVSATQEYRDESDIMGAFVRGALDVTRAMGDETTPGELYRAFNAWCREQATTPWREGTFAKRFARAAERAGIERVKSSSVRYRGLRVRADYRGDDWPPSRTHG